MRQLKKAKQAHRAEKIESNHRPTYGVKHLNSVTFSSHFSLTVRVTVSVTVSVTVRLTMRG